MHTTVIQGIRTNSPKATVTTPKKHSAPRNKTCFDLNGRTLHANKPFLAERQVKRMKFVRVFKASPFEQILRVILVWPRDNELLA